MAHRQYIATLSPCHLVTLSPCRFVALSLCRFVPHFDHHFVAHGSDKVRDEVPGKGSLTKMQTGSRLRERQSIELLACCRIDGERPEEVAAGLGSVRAHGDPAGQVTGDLQQISLRWQALNLKLNLRLASVSRLNRDDLRRRQIRIGRRHGGVARRHDEESGGRGGAWLSRPRHVPEAPGGGGGGWVCRSLSIR